MVINDNFTTSFTVEGNGGYSWSKVAGGVKVSGGTSTTRRTRWFRAKAGKTYTASVMMSSNGSLRLYTKSGAVATETKVAEVNADDVALKQYKISYTAPINSNITLIGVGFLVASGKATFIEPDFIEHKSQTPEIIAMGLVDMSTGLLSTSFASYGVKSIDKKVNGEIQVSLEDYVTSDGTRQIVTASDGSTQGTAVIGSFRCWGLSYGSGSQFFTLSYVDSSGSAVQPVVGNYAQFMVVAS